MDITDETDERRILEKEVEDDSTDEDNKDGGGEVGLKISLTATRSRRDGVPK